MCLKLNVPNVRLLDGSESFDQYLPVTIRAHF
jgi:hypothetical protein